MVKALKGVLIECEPAIKMLLLKLNEEEPFIIEDLDETHLFVQEKSLDVIQQRFEKSLEENVYVADQEVKATW